MTDVFPQRPALTADRNGELFLGEIPVDFNRQYAGCYPAVFFNCTLTTEEGYVAAGRDPYGQPVLYRSFLGHTWTETYLVSGAEDGYRRAEGHVMKMNYDENRHILFLYMSNGETVMVPNCRKCIKIYRSDGAPDAVQIS